MKGFLFSLYLASFAAMSLADSAVTSANLKQLIHSIVSDPTKAQTLVLPEPKKWFGETFGAEKASDLSNEYNGVLKKAGGADGLAQFIGKQVGLGKTDITVFLVDKRTRKGGQRLAQESALRPLPLYSVRFKRPGATHGMTLWSFVHDGEAFRFVGKMRGLR